MVIKVKFFASFRELVGKGSIKVSAETVRDLIEIIAEDYEELADEIFEDPDERELTDFVNILVDGRRIESLNGKDTKLEDEDTVAIFPPVSGG